MNMYLQELKVNQKSTFIWIGSIVGMIVLFLSMFPAFTRDTEQLTQLLSTLPKEILQAFDVQIESFTSILGFYAYIFTYVLLCGAIQAMNFGLSILSKEVKEKTADFLLVKPVSRTQIITAKILAVFTLVVITNIVYIGLSTLIVATVSTKEYSVTALILISLSLFFVQMTFLALGLLLSLIVRKIKSVLPVSLGIVFGFFIIGLFASSLRDDSLRYFTPFKFFETQYIIEHHRYEVPYLAFSIVFVVLSIVLSYILFRKKDIHVG